MMVSSLLFLIFLLSASFNLSYSIQNHTVVFCPEIEKQSLLTLKKSLKSPQKLLSSWHGGINNNCCNWNGVSCNNFTGHVNELHLSGEGLTGKLNPSLLNLKHLTHLDLSLNSFSETIPSFISSFAELEFLDLSDAGFHGKIPHHIGNLSRLHTLVVGARFESMMMDHGSQQLVVDSLEWLSGLSELEYLNMNNANLSRATNWAEVINTLPSLIELHLSSCSLVSINSPLDHVNNSTSLTFINLSQNNFESFAVLKWVLQLSSLVFLDLSSNYFEGTIHETMLLFNATKLQHIDLSFNGINSTIPDWLYLSKDLEFVNLSDNLLHGTISQNIANLTSLSDLNLRENQLSGKLPKEIANLCKLQSLDLLGNFFQEANKLDVFGNMSECFLGSLQTLNLAGNQISGHLSDQFGEFKSLEHLHLGSNSLSGSIPTNLGKLTSLKTLYLENNKLSGNLPEKLGQLYNLVQLHIDNNMLEGVVTESHFTNLTNLMDFTASGNHLTLNVTPNWFPPFQLTMTLALRSWNLTSTGSEPPSWLESQSNVGELDLSDTGISFNVPTWFWGVPTLNLSHNYLHGKIPYLHGDDQLIYLSSNQFTGFLPRIGGTVRELDLSKNSFSGGTSHFLCGGTYSYGLEILHLGGNQLSGELPDCWMRFPFLQYLNLGNNNFSGSIPHSIRHLASLKSLNLYKNQFSGQIPLSLHNCTALVKIDLADNHLDGGIPVWLGTSLVDLRYLILHSNMLSGNISSSICCLNSLQILDLSRNRFSGMIPRCVYNFTAMKTKRSLVDEHGDRDFGYSFEMESFIESASVATKGGVMNYDRILALVTNIDLSNNNLSGDVPKELTSLVELRSLNLSGNELRGVIPDNIGDMKQLECLDLSLNSLSGHIPTSLSHVSSLAYLNLSFNKLTGEIPESTQISGFEASSFVGNDLCGAPLLRSCSRDHGGEQHKEESEGDDDDSRIEWLYVFLCLGFAVGFSGVCTALVLKKKWREAYFELMECIWDEAYVCVYVKWRSLTKPSAPTS